MADQLTSFLLRGLLIGFSIAAPVGPIGVLCVRRTLAHGRLSGFVSGLGAATADAFYSSLAALGLTLLTNFLIAQDHWLSLFGGLFLCYLGIKNALEKPAALIATQGPNTNLDTGSRQGKKSLLADYASTFLLTLTNPLTILSFAAIFGGLGLAQNAGSPTAAMSLIIGVFTGSVLWWLLLSSIANLLRARFMTASGLRWINLVSGIIIFLFGLAALVSIAIPWLQGFLYA